MVDRRAKPSYGYRQIFLYEKGGKGTMIFLIEYNRSKGRIVKFKSFHESERLSAEDFHLKIDLELNKKSVNHEVVLLEASSKNALHQTHRRYFENVDEIRNKSIQLVEQATLNR